MGLTGKVPAHPAQFSPEVLDVFRTLLRPGEHVHDPFAGLGLRLGALCDEFGCLFTGTDIEDWSGRDRRVAVGDSTEASSYPRQPFTVFTSPVYFGNRISTDYLKGPTASTKLAGRHAYGISLGRALDAHNLARVCRPASGKAHDWYHGAAIAHWGEWAVVNVDSPIEERWTRLLQSRGFLIDDVIEVKTRRLGGVANAADRASHEVVIVAGREGAR